MAQPREVIIDTGNLDEGDILVWDGEGFSALNKPAGPGTIPAAITGGQSPTEAEHNALRQYVEDIKDALIESNILDAD